jgi:hypothetical protein
MSELELQCSQSVNEQLRDRWYRQRMGELNAVQDEINKEG